MIKLALGVMISGNAADDVLSGNAADDADAKCLAAMRLGMFFFGRTCLAAMPLPLVNGSSYKADIGSDQSRCRFERERPSACSAKAYTGRRSLATKVFYMPPTAVICSTPTHVARHLPHSKREGAPVIGIVYGRNCHSCSTPLGSALTFSHASAVSAGGAAPTVVSIMSSEPDGDTISVEPMVTGALPVLIQ